MSWKKLQTEGRVRRHKASKKELNELRALIARDLEDAAIQELSDDRRFATAYNAALQTAKMAIACASYKLSSTPGSSPVKASTESVARAILDEIEREEEDIFPIRCRSQSQRAGARARPRRSNASSLLTRRRACRKLRDILKGVELRNNDEGHSMEGEKTTDTQDRNTSTAARRATKVAQGREGADAPQRRLLSRKRPRAFGTHVRSLKTLELHGTMNQFSTERYAQK